MAERTVRIWDLPTRLFHWALVLCLAGSWYTGENDLMDWHMRLGYAALALVLFRVAWGFAGGRTARFAGFLKGPGAVLHHVRALLSRGPWTPEAGHNPLGGWAVLALLAAVAAQAATGLFTIDDLGLYGGPFAERVSEETGKLLRWLHFLNFDLLLVLAGVHVAAVLLYLLVKRDNLIRPMLTGSRRLDLAGQEPLGPVPAWRAPLLLAASAALVWALVTLA